MTTADERTHVSVALPAAEEPCSTRVSLRSEAIVMGLLYLVFELLRDLIPNEAAVADAHALSVLTLERALHIDLEGAAQRLALTVPWTLDAANAFYASGYLVCTIAALAWMAWRHPERYQFWRNALVVTTCLGLVGYYLYPTAPPRLLAQVGSATGFEIVDTLKTLPGPWSIQAPMVSTIGNSYAAMPSLHCAWAFWVALVVGVNARHMRARVLVWLYPITTIVVVIVTGNHFVLDVLAGTGVSLLGVAVLRLRPRRGGARVRRRQSLGIDGPSTPGDGGSPPAVCIQRATS